MKIFLILIMVFCHIADDYYFQGILANMKQRSWWEKNYPADLYKNDWLAALITHGFSWSFMIQLPIMVILIHKGMTDTKTAMQFLLFFSANTAVHCVVDNIKANRKRINLIQDQLIHLIQILLTWCFWVLAMKIV